MNYPHLLSRISAPLMIEPNKFNMIMRALEPKLLSGVMAARPTGPGAEQTSYSVVNGIATIPVQGTLVNRTSGMDAFSGMASYQSIGTMLSEALADPNVKAIMLDVNSPGGETAGVHDLADQIYAARSVKPVWALVNDMAASAAYALASSAEKMVVSRTSIVGAIGVFWPHVDETAADAQQGLKYDFIQAGKQKLEGNSHVPMSDEARARMQSMVDSVYNIFVATVARNRSMAAADVRATEAGIFMGKAAIKAGLADNIGTTGGTYAALGKRVKQSLQAQSGVARKEKPMASLWEQLQARLKTPDDNVPSGQSEAEEYTLAAAGMAVANDQLSTQAVLMARLEQLARPPVAEDPEKVQLRAALADLQNKAKAESEKQQLIMAQACLREAAGYVDTQAGNFTPDVRADAIVAYAQALAFERGISAFFGKGVIEAAQAIENHPSNVTFTLGSGKSNLAESVRVLMSGTKSKEAMQKLLNEGMPTDNLRAISSDVGKANNQPDPVSAALQIVYGPKP